MYTVYISTVYNEQMNINVWGTGSSSISVGEGGVWALVRMMFVDYTQSQMMCCPAHITMNASLSHYLYIMATTPRRGQASSRLINPLTARPKEKWEASQRCSLLIHRLYLTPQPCIACRTHYMTSVISLHTWRYSWQDIQLYFSVSLILIRITRALTMKCFVQVKYLFGSCEQDFNLC